MPTTAADVEESVAIAGCVVFALGAEELVAIAGCFCFFAFLRGSVIADAHGTPGSVIADVPSFA